MFLARPPFLRWGNPDKTLIGLNCFAPFGLGVKSGGNYVANPYEIGGADTTVMSNAILDLIRSTGFDFVRMVIDPATLFTAADDATLDILNALIITGINRRTARGLKVIVDIHPIPNYTAGWSDTDLIDGTAGSKFLRMAYCVARLGAAIHAQWAADRTQCRPSDVCLEIFNEPPRLSSFSGKTAWNTQIKSYYDSVRASLPVHTIVVAGMDFASVDGNTSGVSDATSGITNITRSNFDLNTGFAIHPYEHFIFTHQGIGFYQYFENLSWPASAHPGGKTAADAELAAASGNDPEAIATFTTATTDSYTTTRYFNTDPANAAFIEDKINKAVTWATDGGATARHIFNTEVGVNFNGADLAPEASAAAYLAAQAEAARSAGISCVTIHQKEFTTGFDIMPSGEFVPAIVEALFQ